MCFVYTVSHFAAFRYLFFLPLGEANGEYCLCVVVEGGNAKIALVMMPNEKHITSRKSSEANDMVF